MATAEKPYQPRDAVTAAVQASVLTGGAGLFMSAVQSSLSRQNLGITGVFTKTGGNTALFGGLPPDLICIYAYVHSAIIGGSYSFAKNASANLREVDDAYNTAIGGFVGGATMGLRGECSCTTVNYNMLKTEAARTMPAVIGYGALFSIVLSAFDYTGGALSGWQRDPQADEFERKERLRKNRRRPIQETIDELGEGRGAYRPLYALLSLTYGGTGIHGPAWEERRRERIKQAYGIDVPAK